jgi:alkylation response protein AidB-like acyl-CoA dehydrogenase
MTRTVAIARSLEEFRGEVRAWLGDHVPADWRDRMRGATREQHVEFQKWWMDELRSGGYLAAHWAEEWGGGGFSFDEQLVLYQEMARIRAPRLSLYFVSLHHTYHTLVAEGTDEQRARFLPAILAGEVWCQGFSEPDAGSDLAALRTRAVRVDDHYVVNGQKIWSSYAEDARWCLLLVRTDAAAAKHRGISYLLLDLHSPGIEVRTIKQANGNEEFAEVFLTDVRVPIDNLIGAENDGWRVAQVTLSSERGPGAVELAERLTATHQHLVELGQRAVVRGPRAQSAVFTQRRTAPRRWLGLGGLRHQAGVQRAPPAHQPSGHPAGRPHRALRRSPHPGRGLGQWQLVAGLHRLLRVDDRRGHQRDPAQPPRRAGPGPAA